MPGGVGFAGRALRCLFPLFGRIHRTPATKLGLQSALRHMGTVAVEDPEVLLTLEGLQDAEVLELLLKDKIARR